MFQRFDGTLRHDPHHENATHQAKEVRRDAVCCVAASDMCCQEVDQQPDFTEQAAEAPQSTLRGREGGREKERERVRQRGVT